MDGIENMNRIERAAQRLVGKDDDSALFLEREDKKDDAKPILAATVTVTITVTTSVTLVTAFVG